MAGEEVDDLDHDLSDLSVLDYLDHDLSDLSDLSVRGVNNSLQGIIVFAIRQCEASTLTAHKYSPRREKQGKQKEGNLCTTSNSLLNLLPA